MGILTTDSRFNVLADAAVIASGNLPTEFIETWADWWPMTKKFSQR